MRDPPYPWRRHLAFASCLVVSFETTARAVPDTSGLTAVLLDYGGTLDGDAAHWFDHFVALYEAAGVPVAPPALKHAFYAADAALPKEPGIRTYGLETMVNTHVQLQLAHLAIDDPALARRLSDGFVADTRRAWDRNRALLGRLASRFRLGVVSNSYGNMEALLSEARFAPFEVVLDSAVVGLAKPDPALYALAARRLDVTPAGILHVGDSWERDVLPALACGMHAAWLARPQATAPPAPAPVWRLASLLDLEALLQ